METNVRDPARKRDLEKTYLEYRGLMFRLARDILNDDALAEDAVSEALAKLVSKGDCLKEPTGPKTRRFVAVLTEHAAIDLLRKRRRERTVPLEAAAELRAPAGDPEGRLDLLAALDRLPNEQRAAVQLALCCGMTAKQVARVLGCTLSKAEKLISRGKKALRNELKEGYHRDR